MRNNILGMTAFERHQRFINDYVMWYGDGDKYMQSQQVRKPASTTFNSSPTR